MDLGEISFRITAQADGIQAAFNEAGKEIEAFVKAEAQAGKGATDMGKEVSKGADTAKSGLDGLSKSAQQADMVTVAAFGAIAAAAAKAMTAVTGAIDSGVAAYNQYIAAMKGLQSIAKFKGVDTSQLQNALSQLEDQFMDTASASAALKNLLSRGYSLDQAVNTITRLKDAAAYGRQANYDLAEAVVTATEGLKNENSILVDNAGVTKNVAKMWQDYAKARSLTTANLTQEQKIEAEYLGIMQETAGQIGNAAEAANTLAGAQATTSRSAREMAIAFGSALSPAVELVNSALAGIIATVQEFVTTAPALTAGLSAAAISIGGLFAASKAAEAIIQLSAGFKAAAGGVALFNGAVTLSMPLLAGIAAVIGVAVMAYTSIKKSAEAAAEAEQKAAEARKQEIVDLRTTAGDMRQLASEYEKLSAKQNKTVADKMRMAEIEEQLAEYQTILAKKYGESTPAIMENAGAHEVNAQKINEEADALERLAGKMQGEAEQEGAATRYEKEMKALKDLADAYNVAAQEKANYADRSGYEEEYKAAEEETKRLANLIDEAQQKTVEAFVEKTLTDLRAGGELITEEAASLASAVALELANGFAIDVDDGWEEEVAEAIAGVAKSSIVQTALADVREVSEKVMQGIVPSEQDKEKISDAYTTLLNEIIDGLPGDLILDDDQLSSIVASAMQSAFGDAIKMTGDAVSGDFTEMFSDLAGLAQENAEKIRLANAESALGLKTGWIEAAKESKNASSEISNSANTLASAVGAATGAATAAINNYTTAVDSMVAKDNLYAKVSKKTYEEMLASDVDSITALTNATGKAISSAEEYDAAVVQLGSDLMREQNNINKFKLPALDDASKEIVKTVENLQTVLDATPDTPLFSSIKRQIAESISELNFLGKTISRTKKDYEGYAIANAKASESAASGVKDIATETNKLTKEYQEAEAEAQKWAQYLEQLQGSTFAEATAKNSELLEQLSKDLNGMVIDESNWEDAVSMVQQLNDALGDTATYALGNLQKSFEELSAEIEDTKVKIQNAAEGSEEYEALKQKLNALELAYIAASFTIDDYSFAVSSAAQTTSSAAKQMEVDQLNAVNSAASAYTSAQDEFAKLNAMQEMFQDQTFAQAMATDADAVKKLGEALGMEITEKNYGEALALLAERANDVGTQAAAAYNVLVSENELLTASINDVTAAMEKEAAEHGKDTLAYKKLAKQKADYVARQKQVNSLLKNYAKYAKSAANASLKSSKTDKQSATNLKKYENELEKTAKAYKKNLENKAALDAAMSKVESIEKAHGSLADVNKVLQKLPGDLKTTVKSFDDAKKYIQNNSDKINNAIKGQMKSLEDELKKWEEAKKAARDNNGTAQIKLSANLSATVNTSQIDQKIAEIKAKIKEFNDLAQQIGSPTTGGGGGGGGGGNKESAYAKELKGVQHRVNMFSEFDRNATQKEYNMYLAMYNKYIKQLNAIDNSRMNEKQKKRQKEKLMTEDERKSLEETLKNLKETLRKEAFDKDMAYYEHAVAMGRMSTKKQIEYLKKVLKTHKLTREERWQIEEQIYDLEQDLADKAKEKEEKRLEALKKKAEEAKQKAKEALEKQKDHATTVYDQLVEALRNRYNKERDLRKQALNDQIAALEAEQDAEEEARQRQEYEENLAEKQRQLRIEKSARKRRELQAEIDKMILDEERRLADNARQAQIDDLNRQIDAVDEMYDDLTSDENLNQEALKLAMSGNIKAMENIIKEYTPKFEDAGSALMDYLTTGITKKKTTLLNALDTVFKDADKSLKNQIAKMGSASTSVSSKVTVNLSIGQINEASDYQTVADRLQAAIRSATRG